MIVSSTRTAVMLSWRAALRKADRHGVLSTNHASECGKMLEDSGGSVRRALVRAQASVDRGGDGVLFWSAVRDLLVKIRNEEEPRRLASGEN